MSTQSIRGLRVKEAAQKIGCTTRTLWNYAKNIEGFPRPVQLGPGCTVFFEHELDAWMLKRAESRQPS